MVLCNKASIVICLDGNSTYLFPMQETRVKDFSYLFLRNVNLCENLFFVFLIGDCCRYGVKVFIDFISSPNF